MEASKPASLRVPKRMQESIKRLSRPKSTAPPSTFHPCWVSSGTVVTADVEAVSASIEAAKLGIATPGLGPQGYILNRVVSFQIILPSNCPAFEVRAFVSQCDTDDDGRVTASDIICMAETNGSHRAKALALVIANIEDMIADIVVGEEAMCLRFSGACLE